MAVIQEQREFVVQAAQGFATYHFNFSIEKPEHIRVFIADVEKTYGTDFIVDVPSSTVTFTHPASLISGQWIYICGATPTERITDFIGEYVLSDAANSQGDNIQRQIQEINTKIKKCIRAPQDNYWPNEQDTAGLNLPSASQRKNKLVGFDARGKDIEMVDIEGRLDGRYLRRTSNLSDVNNVAVSRQSLGLGDAAVCDVGTDSGNVLPGDYAGLLSPQEKNTLTSGNDSDALHTHLSLIRKSEKGVTIPTLDSKRKILQEYIPDLEYVKCLPRRSEHGNVAIFNGAVGDISDAGKKAPSSDFVGTSDEQTISNKTIDCSENKVTNVGKDEIDDDFLSEEISEDATHDTIPTTKAVRDYGETKIPSSEKGAPKGVASLGADGKVPEQQLPPIALDGVRLHGDASVDHVVVFDDTNGNVKDSGIKASDIVSLDTQQRLTNKAIDCSDDDESSNIVTNLSITSVDEKYLCRDVSQEETPENGQFFTLEAFDKLWGQANGVCDLDENGQVPIERLNNVPFAKLENVGSGAKVYRDNLNDSAQLRTISSGDNEVVVTQVEDEIKISHSRPVIADLTRSLGTELVTSGGIKNHVAQKSADTLTSANEYTNQKDTATNAKINNLITSRAALLTKELNGGGAMAYSQITVGNVGDVLSVVMTDNGPTPSWTQPTTTSKIFFDAYMANEMSIDRATETLLPFDAIKNASDNTVFDTNQHEFVAPISGTYEFDITVALRVYDLSQRIAVFFAISSANGFRYHAVGTFKPPEVFSQEYREPSVHSFPLRLSVSAGDRISAWIATNKSSLVQSLSGYSASFWQDSTCHFSGSFIG